jgi:hypothetical protein
MDELVDSLDKVNISIAEQICFVIPASQLIDEYIEVALNLNYTYNYIELLTAYNYSFAVLNLHIVESNVYFSNGKVYRIEINENTNTLPLNNYSIFIKDEDITNFLFELYFRNKISIYNFKQKIFKSSFYEKEKERFNLNEIIFSINIHTSGIATINQEDMCFSIQRTYFDFLLAKGADVINVLSLPDYCDVFRESKSNQIFTEINYIIAEPRFDLNLGRIYELLNFNNDENYFFNCNEYVENFYEYRDDHFIKFYTVRVEKIRNLIVKDKNYYLF